MSLLKMKGEKNYIATILIKILLLIRWTHKGDRTIACLGRFKRVFLILGIPFRTKETSSFRDWDTHRGNRLPCFAFLSLELKWKEMTDKCWSAHMIKILWPKAMCPIIKYHWF